MVRVVWQARQASVTPTKTRISHLASRISHLAPRLSNRLFSPLILILFLLSPYLFSNLVFTLLMGLDQRLWLIFKFSCRNSISSHTEGLMLRRLWYDSARNKRCFEQRTDKLLINMPYIMSISAY